MSGFRMSRLFQSSDLDLSLPFESSVAFSELQRTTSASSTDSTAPSTPQNWGGVGWDTYDAVSFVDSPATTCNAGSFVDSPGRAYSPSISSSCAPARLPPAPPTRKPMDLDLEWPSTTETCSPTRSPTTPPTIATVSVPIHKRTVADAYNDGCVSPLEELQRSLPKFPSFILPEAPATPETDVFPAARDPPIAHAREDSVEGRDCVAALQAMPSFDFWPQAPRASAMSSVSAPGELEGPAELDGGQPLARARSVSMEKKPVRVSRQPLVLDTRPDTLAGLAKEDQRRTEVSRPRQYRQQPPYSPGDASFAASPRQAPPVPPKQGSYRTASPPNHPLSKPAVPEKEILQEPKRASTYVWAKLKQVAPSRSNTVSAPNPPRKNSVAAGVMSGPHNFSRSPRTPEESENPLLRQLSHLAEAEQRARTRVAETPRTVEAPRPRAPTVVLEPSLPLKAVQTRAAPPRPKQHDLLGAMPDVFVQPPTPTHPPPMEHPSEHRGRRRDVEVEPHTPPHSADSSPVPPPASASPAPKLGRKGSKYAHATSDRGVHPAYQNQTSILRNPSRKRGNSYERPTYQPVRRDASPVGGRGRENVFPVSPVRSPSRSGSPCSSRAASPSPIDRQGPRGDNMSADSPRGNITNPSAWSTYQAMRNAERPQGNSYQSSSYTSPQSARPTEVYKAYDNADAEPWVEDRKQRNRSGREADVEARRRSAVPGAMRSPGGDVKAMPEVLRPRRGVMVGGS